MVHAFDLVDGAEILALLPPDLLAKQVTLYNTYVTEKAKAVKSAPVGQKKDPAQHVYGVANSMRVADIWDSKTNKYKTMLFITEGPGGTGIHALDITAPYPGRTQVPYKVWKHSAPTDDNDYTVGKKDFPADDTTSATTPFTALWGITANGASNTDTVTGLGQTWAVPALGASGVTTWELVVGAGWDPALLTSGTPVVMRIDPLKGTVTKYTALTNEASGTYVHNQTFADNGIFQTNSQFFHPDNLVDLGVQPDLHGHLWLLDKGASPAWKPAALTDSGSVIKGQPLYYAAALAPYPAAAATHDIFAFSSGTFYEKSSTVTGPNVGTTGNFMPAIVLATRKLSDKSVCIAKYYLKDMLYKSAKIGARSQLTQYPLLLVPKPGTTGNAIALYMVYDPTAGTCVGSSYALRATFDPLSCSTATFTLDFAGFGASAGFAVDPHGDIHPSQSFVGEGGRAFFPAKLNMPPLPPAGGLGGAVIWWAELQ
jgi:hypothetical protein